MSASRAIRVLLALSGAAPRPTRRSHWEGRGGEVGEGTKIQVTGMRRRVGVATHCSCERVVTEHISVRVPLKPVVSGPLAPPPAVSPDCRP
ncbi:hypothetical protein B0T18DRAFT_415385 [Schizothecium vesticola]|uniref:Uncharacterized protein n=1 Tax=Schizothecium vesticola TaxID=314040 RepID=A0AA40EQ99_9PEZI|nr:hypothetical protein B0T18DRAFT_415385 [Schizothecium vesticola]